MYYRNAQASAVIYDVTKAVSREVEVGLERDWGGYLDMGRDERSVAWTGNARKDQDVEEMMRSKRRRWRSR